MASGTKRFGAPSGDGGGEFDEPTRAQSSQGKNLVGVGARSGHAAAREPGTTGSQGERTAITRAPLPRESFLPEGTSSQTVMMQAQRSVDLPSHLQKTVEPPEISLTEHALEGVPLDARMVLAAEPDSERAAAFRVLRHHLLEQGRPQVVVVSSARSGEGKTTTAVNLAMALSECERARVLLVEATVRRPQLAALFRFVPPWCFAEQLAAHRHQPLLPWSLVAIPSLSLHVAAINPRVEQSQLLDAPAFSIAMERLRMAEFDHIVIDAPSVIGSADVNLIQDAADGVLLVAKSRNSTARDLRRAAEQLRPTKIIGTVLLD
jgi:Mrp family chromosome partitioning ATPase